MSTNTRQIRAIHTIIGTKPVTSTSKLINLLSLTYTSLLVLDGHTHAPKHTLFCNPPAVKPQWEERRNWSWLLKIIEQIGRRHATAAHRRLQLLRHVGTPAGRSERGGTTNPRWINDFQLSYPAAATTILDIHMHLPPHWEGRGGI